MHSDSERNNLSAGCQFTPATPHNLPASRLVPNQSASNIHQEGLEMYSHFAGCAVETAVLKPGRAALACAERLADGCGLPDCAPLYPLAPVPAFLSFFSFFFFLRFSARTRTRGAPASVCRYDASPLLKSPFFPPGCLRRSCTSGLWSPEPGAVRAVMKA